MKLSGVRNERGNVLLFVAGLLLLFLVMGGVAVDLAYYMTVDDELQRAMDAAALAGAGNLGFDDTVFPVARQAAVDYAAANPYRLVSGAPSGGSAVVAPALDLNTANSPNGNVVLGIWDPTANPRFTPSLDGTRVNAVQCQITTQLPTTFLRLIGINSLTAYAQAIAIANPPAQPPTNACLFPIGLADCPFVNNSSQGCGVPVSFITSSGKGGEEGGTCITPPCTNTGAWVNLDGTSTPNAEYLRQKIQDAANGGCAPSNLQTGDPIGASNGMVQSVFDTLETAFVSKYNASDTIELKNSEGEIVYSGKGWDVYVPVLGVSPACPAAAITGTPPIVGWTRFVITQVINKGECVVANHYAGNQWDNLCPPANGTSTNPVNKSSRGVFGYYACELQPSNPNPMPSPRTALAQRLRLVH
ncbi:MAG TPA: pilus assembly protein TadG-related protein [Candidatus Tectomicrobia bacterium]|nr:pilus assembly protein TadG-related protein [Candidatus Tectomicrobia bacterium]